jgi:hypothetical protein
MTTYCSASRIYYINVYIYYRFKAGWCNGYMLDLYWTRDRFDVGQTTYM